MDVDPAETVGVIAEGGPDGGVVLDDLAADEAVLLEKIMQVVARPGRCVGGFEIDVEHGDDLAVERREPVARNQGNGGVGKRAVERAGAEDGVGVELGVSLPTQLELAEVGGVKGGVIRGQWRPVTLAQAAEVLDLLRLAPLACQHRQV